jgi:N-acetylmuramoyl-L-alanine amidase
MDGARRHYRRVLEDLPQGDMAPLARKRLTELGTQARLEAIRTWSGGGYTRVVLDLSRSAPFTVRNLPPNPAAAKPDRLYLDLARSRLVGDCPGCVPISDGLVRQVRAGQNTPDMVRVVLDLHGPATYRVFPLDQPSRIVIDVFRAAPQEDVIASIIGDKTRQAAPSRPLRIVIDPGHGGKDPGAVGPNGLMEKDVTLALGRELARVLEERLGCETRLTRTGDYYLGLENRTAMANAFGADLFISIHANANRSRSARGIETYYLDRPSDRAARRLAALENAGTEEGLAEVEHILTDVLLTPKINESRVLATAIQGALVARIDKEYGSTRDLGVKRGPFYVLTGAVMPSVLVETSFITHPVEAKRLGDESFQKRVAQAMADGIAAFVKGS